MRFKFPLPRRTTARTKPAKPQLPELTTPEDYQREARAAPPILRYWGLRYSAVLNRDVLDVRYRRHIEFFGGIPWLRIAIMWAVAIAACGAVGFGIFLHTSTSMDDALRPRNPYLEGAIAAFGGLLFSSGTVVMVRLRDKWNTAYGPVIIIERATDGIVNLLMTYRPRLAFITGADYFSGPTRQAGPQRGTVLIDLPVGVRLVDLEYDDIYELDPARIGFTTVPATEVFDALNESALSGEEETTMKQSKAQRLLRESWAWGLSAINLVILLFMTAGQSESGI